MNDLLIHYGIPKRSGRYPYGSGDRPYQHRKQIEKKQNVVKNVFKRNIEDKKLISKNELSSNDRISLKKGEKVQHISGIDFNEIRKGQLYVTADKYDNKLYESFLSGMLTLKGYSAKKVILKLKENLESPTENEQLSIFKKEMDKQKVVNDVAEWLVKKGKFKTKEEAIRIESKKSTFEIYSDFINSCEQKSESRTIFYNALKKRRL